VAGKIRLGVEFTGIANGLPVTITGKAHVGLVGESGSVDGDRRLDLELHVDRVPLAFDPALLVLGGLDAVLLLAARDDALPVPDRRLHVHLDFTLLDENYRAMGGFELAPRSN